jgi:hypothetical protein
VVITEPTTLENLTLNINQEILVKAPIAVTFESLLEQMGPANEHGDAQPMPMVLEPRPGGRWYRDLGGDDGHFWGTVQAIRRPTLLEICGPLFMSYPVVSNVQYRLKEVDGGTLITFRHAALGFVPDEYRQNTGKGWTALHERVRRRAVTIRAAH